MDSDGNCYHNAFMYIKKRDSDGETVSTDDSLVHKMFSSEWSVYDPYLDDRYKSNGHKDYDSDDNDDSDDSEDSNDAYQGPSLFREFAAPHPSDGSWPVGIYGVKRTTLDYDPTLILFSDSVKIP